MTHYIALAKAIATTSIWTSSYFMHKNALIHNEKKFENKPLEIKEFDFYYPLVATMFVWIF